MRALHLAVFGAGHMGRFHAQKLAQMQEGGAPVVLAGIADLDLGRAQELADRVHARAVADHRELLGEADAVVVAVPTIAHYRVVRDALEAGLDVLVEKPIAATLAEAEDLLALARSKGRLLQVGHLERFNAALRKVQGLIHRPRFVEAHRMGPFPDRATDVDVVRDLMIHDIDIIQQFVGEEPERVEAIGVPVLSRQVDIANARLTFPGGCVANLTASRVSPTPMRKVRFFQNDGYFSIDFLAQSVAVFRRFEPEGDGPPRVEFEQMPIDREDSLLAELEAFCEAVRARGYPAVTGDQGLRALRTALRVVEAMPPLDDLR